MKGEEAMEIFKIAKQKGMLPTKLDDLVPLSFIGQTAVTFYRQMIKGFDQLKMTEAQRKRTLKDGQEAGEMLLDIETRIGELLPPPEEALKTARPGGGREKPHLGMERHRAQNARAIAKHPEIVEKVKAQARDNEDIPTRTAVVNEIKYQKEKERRKEAEGKRVESKTVIAIEQVRFINALDRCIMILPKQVCKATIGNRIKELRKDGEAIIHESKGMRHIDQDEILNDEEIADSLKAWFDWLLSMVSGLATAANPAEPLMLTMKRTLRESLTSEERRRLSKACAKVKALLDYEEAYSEE